MPSYRVRPSDDGGPPWRLIAIGGGLAGALLVGAALAWGISRMGGGARSVPLIEPDPRPFKVRPDDPGGLRVPNQDELIFERNRGSAPQGGARLAPEPEAPRIDALRAQVAQPAPRPAAPATPNAAAPQPGASAAAPAGAPAARTAPAPGAAPQAAPAQPTAPAQTAAAPAARPTPAPGGTIRVQLGALSSDEAARGEWIGSRGGMPTCSAPSARRSCASSARARRRCSVCEPAASRILPPPTASANRRAPAAFPAP